MNIIVVGHQSLEEADNETTQILKQVADVFGTKVISASEAIKTLCPTYDLTKRDPTIDNQSFLFKYLQQLEKLQQIDMIITTDDCAFFSNKLKTPYICIVNHPYKWISDCMTQKQLFNEESDINYGLFYPSVQKTGTKHSIANVATSKFLEKYCNDTEISCTKIIEPIIDIDFWTMQGQVLGDGPITEHPLCKKYGLPHDFSKPIAITVCDIIKKDWTHMPAIIQHFENKIFWIIVTKQKDAKISIKAKNAKVFINPTDMELRELYSCADIGVFPSAMKGFNVHELQCASCNTPIVATKTGVFYNKHLSYDIEAQKTGVMKKEKVAKYDHNGESVKNEFDEVMVEEVDLVMPEPIIGWVTGGSKDCMTNQYIWEANQYIEGIQKVLFDKKITYEDGKDVRLWIEPRKVVVRMQETKEQFKQQWVELASKLTKKV